MISLMHWGENFTSIDAFLEYVYRILLILYYMHLYTLISIAFIANT